MRGLREVLCVVVENAHQVNIASLCKLYTACEVIFTEDLINIILDKAKPHQAWDFFKRTGRGRSRTIHKLLDGELHTAALDLLDETCDEATYTRVLSVPCKNRNVWYKLEEEMDTMKRLGYKRDASLFENVLTSAWCMDPKKLFREMVEEHPDIALSRGFYQSVVDFIVNDLEFKHFVAMQAKAKGIKLCLDYFLDYCSEDCDWDKALGFLLEIVETPSDAYQLTLNAQHSEENILGVLKEAVRARITVDATAKLYSTPEILREPSVLANAMRNDMIILDDEKLHAFPLESIRRLIQLAGENSFQEFPKTIRSLLKHEQCNYDDVLSCLEAFCHLTDPDDELRDIMVSKLETERLPGEAKYVKDMFSGE